MHTATDSTHATVDLSDLGTLVVSEKVQQCSKSIQENEDQDHEHLEENVTCLAM